MRNSKVRILYGCFLAFAFFLIGCQKNYTPKPIGYQRIEFPEKEYTMLPDTFPYLFEYPVYTTIETVKEIKKKGWINLDLTEYNGNIHLTYYPINNDFSKHIEDARGMAYKHVVKADAIPETPFANSKNNVYGMLYDIKGNTAASVAFYLTDSTNHFLYGSLYFNTSPNKDSLAPVIDFFRKDIVHLMETLSWN